MSHHHAQFNGFISPKKISCFKIYDLTKDIYSPCSSHVNTMDDKLNEPVDEKVISVTS